MASPQEVLEAFIPHPLDSTEATRSAAAKRVLQGLELNGYYFMRRQKPMDRQQSGECGTCGCDMVHVEHSATFTDMSLRLASLTQMLDQRDKVLRDVAGFMRAIVDGAVGTIEEARRIAANGIGIVHDAGDGHDTIKQPPMTPADLVPPQHNTASANDFQTPA